MGKQPDLNFSHSNFERALDTVLWTYPPNWFITGQARIQNSPRLAGQSLSRATENA